MENKKTSILQEEDKFMLRLPDGMRSEFKKIADESGRSLNAELVHRLKTSLSVPADVASACQDLHPIDRVDFSVKVLQRAGFKVLLPPGEV